MGEIYYQQDSEASERITAEIFQSLKFACRKLDKNRGQKKPPKMPDFLLSRHNLQIICEVKTIDSCGYDTRQGNYAIKFETRENALVFPLTELQKKFCDIFDNAVAKRKSLLENCLNFERVPYLIAIFHTNVTDPCDYIKTFMENYPEISAAIFAHRDCSFYSQKDEAFHWHYALNPKARTLFDPYSIGNVCKFDGFLFEKK